jgi:LmbE family N-acetylglucosaminyl deacetylase
LTPAQNQQEDDMSQIHQVERVMAVMAHPDDADVRAGGTIARWAAAGKEVTYVMATSGNRGGDGSVPESELAATREAEQRAAAEVLGVRHVVFLGHEDGYVTPSIELRRDITREIRRYRPEVVITHNPTRHYGYGNHPDHFAVGEATYAAIYPTSRNPMAFPELRLEGLEPWEVSWSMAIDAARPNHYEDVGSTSARKLEAIARHGSQYGPEYLIAAEGIMRTHAAQAAANGHPGMELAEVFRLRFEGHPKDQFTTGRMVPG